MERILVVEDSPTQAAHLVATLEAQGFTVTSAGDGENALRRFAAAPFDLVISDVVMPGISGYELCRAIKADPRRRVPVILVTSLAEPMDVIRGLECGADNFLRKPYKADDLVRRLERILKTQRVREAGPPSPAVEVMFLETQFTITSDKAQILDLLISTFEDTLRANDELQHSKAELAAANAKIQHYATALEGRVKERTAELASANEGLQAAMRAREKAEQQLIHAQRIEAIGNLTGGLAHDFNNLLGVIIGNLDLLRPMVERLDQAGELVTESLDAALRGADLTRRLLAFARRQPLKPERVNINELVTETTRLLERVLGENVEVILDLDPQTWPVTVDPAQLESSLTNLATNARDAMPKGGRLRLSTRNRHLDADYAARNADVIPGDYAVIEVSDTGIGIPPAVISRIFEPFYTTKGIGKGTGLGLAMVFGFIKQSKGHINVYSEEGIGTIFRLFLPRGDAAAVRSRRPSGEEASLGNGETVLVVEDNAAMRRIVLLQLQELGYRVIAAGNAAGALALLAREAVDVVLSDVVMPGTMNGIALARAVLSRWPAVRVVLTSGFTDTILLQELGAMHEVHLLSKPYRRADLARTLREVLDHRVRSAAGEA